MTFDVLLDRFYAHLLELPERPDLTSAIPETMDRLRDVTLSELAVLEIPPLAHDAEWSVVTPAIDHIDLLAARHAGARAVTQSIALSIRTTTGWMRAEPIAVDNYAVGALTAYRPLRFGEYKPSECDRILVAARRIATVTQGRNDRTRTLAEQVEALRERRVREALQLYDWNVSAVARHLGVGRAFVYSILQRGRK